MCQHTAATLVSHLPVLGSRKAAGGVDKDQGHDCRLLGRESSRGYGRAPGLKKPETGVEAAPSGTCGISRLPGPGGSETNQKPEEHSRVSSLTRWGDQSSRHTRGEGPPECQARGWSSCRVLSNSAGKAGAGGALAVLSLAARRRTGLSPHLVSLANGVSPLQRKAESPRAAASSFRRSGHPCQETRG